MQSQLPQIYYILFTAVTAAGVLLQAFVLLGMYIAIRQSSKKLHEVTAEVRVHLVPALASARHLLEEISPKLKVASTNILEVSNTLRHQANHINDTLESILDKTNAQVERVDEMVGGVLNTVSHAASTVENAASAPIRQVSGIFAGIKTGFDVFFSRQGNSSRHVKVPIETVDYRGEERPGVKSVSVSTD
jgi:hypothetical protein